MPIRRLHEPKYYLISFDSEGVERQDDQDGVMSEVISNAIDSETPTDIFIFSHGWKGDIPAALDQYDRWTGAMIQSQADIVRIEEVRAGFRALLLGLHWPSQPWGDEEFGRSSFGSAGATSLSTLVDLYASRMSDTPRARQALETIFESAKKSINPPEMPEDVRKSYEILNEESGLGTGGQGSRPGDDREAFHPELAFKATKNNQVPGFGGGIIEGILSPLRQLTFWKMKDRGRKVGESGAAQLLTRILEKTASGRDVRIHLIGHSFGCIVVSAMLASSENRGSLIRQVDSLTLIQGALSLWSYCESIPSTPERAGYFHQIIAEGRVKGPIVTTRSKLDRAVGFFYPLGAGVAHEVGFGPRQLPKYGGLGAFGIQGPGPRIVDQVMLPTDSHYGFERGKVYNIESSRFIKNGAGPSGAHNDIYNAGVAHAVWEAVMSESN